MRVLLSVWSGCAQPPDEGPGAIEITGYLDASRLAWTYTEGRIWAAGLDGGASAGSAVLLVGEQESAQSAAGGEGSFSLSIEASIGERVTLSVDGADEGEAQHHEIVPPPPPPAYSHVSAAIDEHEEDTVSIELELQSARDDGRFWALNTALPGEVTALEAHLGGLLHAGSLGGNQGDALLLWLVPEEGDESEPIEVIVGSEENR